MLTEEILNQNVLDWFRLLGAAVGEESDFGPTEILYQDLLLYLGPSLAMENKGGLEIGAIVWLNITGSDEIDKITPLLLQECSVGISIDLSESVGTDVWVINQLQLDLDAEKLFENLTQFLDVAMRCRRLVEDELDPIQIVEPDLTQSALDEIRALVGVEEIIALAEELKASFEVAQLRKQAGLKFDYDIPHLVFTGNPGTGKTTVANKIGRLLKEIGLLSSGHLVEARPKDLMGQYMGQTAPKTENVIKKAIGGVLFIDEAYSLNNNIRSEGGGSYGEECITTLLTQMENRKGEFVVIVAGYPEEMSRLLDSNPGLRSRFDQTWNFRDYTNNELVQIIKARASKEEYLISPACTELLLTIFGSLHRDKHFGNARTARNILQAMKRKLAIRVIKDNLTDRESLMTFHPEDIEQPSSTSRRRQIGFAPIPRD